MAKIIEFNKESEDYSFAYGFWDVAVAIKRGNATPLDKSSLYKTLADAQNYAKNDITAYVGQILSVLDNSTTSDGTGSVKAYIITDTDGTLVELGSGSGKADIGVEGEVVEIVKYNGRYYEKTDTEYKTPITDTYVNGEKGGEGVYVKLHLIDDATDEYKDGVLVKGERNDYVYIKNTDIIDITNYYTKDEIDEMILDIDSSINRLDSSVSTIEGELEQFIEHFENIDSSILRIDTSLVDHEERITALENVLDGSIVNSIQASTSTDFVNITPFEATDGNVDITLDLVYAEVKQPEIFQSSGIATDGYVDEKMAWTIVEDEEEEPEIIDIND